jgi:AcrR family transcriptional regulator
MSEGTTAEDPTLSTRERLRDAAWDCIRTGGVEAATSRAITTRANANLGAITYHFGSKDALLSEAVCAGIERLVAPAMDALDTVAGDASSRLIAAVARLESSFAAVRADAPSYLDALLHSRHVPGLHDQLGKLFSRLRHLLAKQMADQQRAGLLPAWVDPEPMAGLLIAVAEGVIMQSIVDETGPPISAMATQFTQLLLASGPGLHPHELLGGT